MTTRPNDQILTSEVFALYHRKAQEERAAYIRESFRLIGTAIRALFVRPPAAERHPPLAGMKHA